MLKAAKSGFTLIELAVVIAVIAILASVAIPRFARITDGAERAVAENFAAQLNTAAATFTAEQARVPTAYTQFVAGTAAQMNAANATFTIALPVDRNGGALCSAPQGAQITCNGFQAWNVTYNFANGTTRMTIAPKSGGGGGGATP